MADLKGYSTISGYPILHSGMTNPFFEGDITSKGSFKTLSSTTNSSFSGNGITLYKADDTAPPTLNMSMSASEVNYQAILSPTQLYMHATSAVSGQGTDFNLSASTSAWTLSSSQNNKLTITMPLSIDNNLEFYNSAGTSQITFQSNTNRNSDYGFIRYDSDNNRYALWGDSAENSALVVGVENDVRGTASDAVVLYSSSAALIDTPVLRFIQDNAWIEFKTGGATLQSQSNGTIRAANANGYVDIAPANNGFAHFQTDRAKFYFNKDTYVAGRLYQGASYDQPVWGNGDFALQAGGYGYDVSNTNINDLRKAGLYRGNNMTGAPDTNWYYIIQQDHDANYCSQIAFNFFNARVYTRERTWINSAWVWTPWVRVTIDNDFSWRQDYGTTLNGTANAEGTMLLANGYQLKFGWFGLSINATVDYTFPVAFPNAAFTGCAGQATNASSWGTIHYKGLTRTTITATNIDKTNAGIAWYIALGY